MAEAKVVKVNLNSDPDAQMQHLNPIPWLEELSTVRLLVQRLRGLQNHRAFTQRLKVI
jgi:hypothetical protein